MTRKQKIEAFIPQVREAIKSAGFKARVAKLRGEWGNQAFAITVPAYDVEFKPEQIRLFCQAAKDAGFTQVMGAEIDVERLAGHTGPGQRWEFWA